MITDPGRLISSFTWEEDTFSSSGSIQEILAEDKYRIAFMISVQTGSQVHISTLPNVTSSTGFLIDGSLAPFQLSYRDFGAVVSGSWYLAATFMATNGVILSARFDPRNQRVN